MLHLLIVDDEPLAVNYLLETLEEAHLPLEMTKAFSGKDALAKAKENKVDILLTDIRMPGMSGMELADEILSIWPRCRVIFLTGYNDFHYIQSALRKGGIDYVLKTEGDGVIIAAIEKAIAAIEAEVNEEQIIQKARQQIHLALPSLRRDYLIELLQGEVDSTSSRRKRFAELDIHLDPESPVLAVLGRIDAWGSFAAPGDRILLIYSIHNIAEEYFRPAVRFVSFQYDRIRTVWLIQPREGDPMEFAQRTAAYCAERIQTACKNLLKVPFSIALSSEPAGWETVGERIESLKLQLTFCLGAEEEMLITEPKGNLDQERLSSRSLEKIGRMRAAIHKLDFLEMYMDKGLKQDYLKMYQELFQVDSSVFANDERKWLGLELFAHLSAFFLTYLNKRNLFGTIGANLETEKIYNPNTHVGLDEMIRFFGNLGATIAELNANKQRERSDGMIERVHRYIDQYLHEELSLTRLAGLVYLSPSYFSRLYKQKTGTGLLEYIIETRIQKSKLLLKTTNKKIHEIAAEVGLESAPYFTRLFRKKVGMTPQEYRERSKRMETL
mgnify:CR=1 FL=1